VPSPSAPPAPAFSIAVVPDRARAVVRPAGDLDLLTVPALRAEVDRLQEAGFAHVLVDLCGLTFIDSEGVKLLLRLRGDAERAGRRVAVAPGPEHVQRVIALTMTAGILLWEDGREAGP